MSRFPHDMAVPAYAPGERDLPASPPDMPLGIYVCDAVRDFPSPIVNRLIIVAVDSGTARYIAAERLVGDRRGEIGSLAQWADTHVTVGRLGDYCPGQAGSAMTAGALVVAQERR